MKSTRNPGLIVRRSVGFQESLGHYVLADVYNRRGEPAKAQEELSKARKLEAALRKKPLPAL
jgi:hypothetical protein